ncbi:MAG: hypothetical protein ACXVX0_09690 [Blastococcus sp.]
MRGPLVRVLLGFGIALGGIVAVAGALELSGSGLIVAGIAGVLAACMAAGIVREAPGASRRRILEAAAQAGGATLGTILVLAGTAVLAGGVVATILGGLALTAGVTVALVRGRRSDRSGVRTGFPRAGRPVPMTGQLPPVSTLTTSDLGQEWVRTSALLGRPLTPDALAAVVARRQEAIDELERRDPLGFRRWLAAGSWTDNDPAGYVQGDRTAGTDAA